MSKFRVPTLSSSNVTVRLTTDPIEIESANRLVFANYVAANYWENNAKHLENKFAHSPMRKVIVAYENGHLIGTISLILDSPMGLPSDGAQAPLMQQLRANSGTFAEISGFAMDRGRTAQSRHALFLVSYVLQYSFYYAGVDRLAASCIAAHSRFFESALGFSIISGPTRYRDANVVPYFYLLTLDLREAHSALSATGGKNLARFLLADPQPCQHFPPEGEMKQQRETKELIRAHREVA